MIGREKKVLSSGLPGFRTAAEYAETCGISLSSAVKALRSIHAKGLSERRRYNYPGGQWGYRHKITPGAEVDTRESMDKNLPGHYLSVDFKRLSAQP